MSLDSRVSVPSFMLELGRSLVVMWEGGVAGGWGLGVLGVCGGVGVYPVIYLNRARPAPSSH